jgi:DHA1 family bicyclomycin/chloramphenicol resistance-like MFS transporter
VSSCPTLSPSVPDQSLPEPGEEERRPALTRRRLLVLAMATALGSLSIDLYLPAFPELASQLHTSQPAVQITLTACVVGLAVGQLIAGPLSDSFGRRAPIVLGLLGWSLTSGLCALAPSIEAFTALRFAQGLAGAAGLVVSRAVVRDLASGPEMVRAFARLMLIVGVVPILAPTLGGIMLKVMPWQGLFVALAGFGLVSVVVVWVGLTETLPVGLRRPGGLRSAVGSYWVLLRDPRYVRAASVMAFTFAALFVYVSGSAFVMRTVFGLDAAGYGLMFAAHSVALVAGNQLSGRTAGRWPASRHLMAALGVALLGALALTVVALTGLGGLPAAVGAIMVTVFGVGLSLPVASSITLAGHPDRAGAASALLGLLQFSVGGVIAPFVGAFGSRSLLPLAGGMGACILVAAVLQGAGPAGARLRRRVARLTPG